jgi:hypothetical protein
MPECIICGSYTKYQKGKCYSCHTNRKTEIDDLLDDVLENEGGLDDREWERRYNMLKGRIAETLIQELFLSLKYNVFRYGMEHTVPGITELLKGIKTDVAYQIRKMPDFVIQKNKDVFFVEVKFRASGSFTLKDLDKNYPYDNAYIILVSKKHIKCISVAELREGKEITPDTRNYLGSRKEFELDKEVIVQFCEFAVQFFAQV